MKLTIQQKSALLSIRSFIDDTDASVFILKGYAGTGKTTMIRTIIEEVKTIRPNCVLMAPTGRAAKMLRAKTGEEASTIHHAIYNFNMMVATNIDENGNLVGSEMPMEGTNSTKGVDSLDLWFSLKDSCELFSPERTLYIVDEASMISSVKSNGEMLHFGSDVLLDDLISYVQPHKGGKVLFIGDPAQLPPVGDNQSSALIEKYFIDRGLHVCSAELTEVIRQSEGSTILRNAMMLRDTLNSKVRNSISFERGLDVIDIHAAKVAETYCNLVPSPCIGESVVICFSNSIVKDYNEAIRKIYFPGVHNVVAGDILQIVKNSVGTHHGIDMFNGDFAQVLSVSETTEVLSAPVWSNLQNGREKSIVSVSFRDVTLLLEDGTQVSCKIIDDLLNNRERSLSPLQTLSLYINFKMRFQDSIKDSSLSSSERKIAFNNALMSDPYFNAIQVKYGYAITAHKSQGGEWKTVFVDYTGRTGLNDDSLRWCYTATTRSKGTLYGINFPSATPLSKMVVNPILKYSKVAKEAFSFGLYPADALLPGFATSSQRAKLNCVRDNLAGIDVIIQSIECLHYVDRYHIQTIEGELIVDCQYNGAGMYTAYKAQSHGILANDVLQCFRDESKMEFFVDYLPSADHLTALYSSMLSLCDDIGITITNIVEHSEQYNVVYYLRTSGNFSQIMFYFRNNGLITHALPSSDIGGDDMKMVELIDKLSNPACISFDISTRKSEE